MVHQFKPLKKVIWALDPFSEMPTAMERAIQCLSLIAKDKDIKIEPVYVLGTDSLHWVGHVMPPQIEKFIPISLEALDKKLEGVKLKGLNKGRILVNESNSKRMDIETLLRFASEEDADMIVLNTHARKGVSKFLLGSFAENVLMKSDIPLLLVSPQINEVKKLDHVLFPSDFSDFSKKGLDEFLTQMSGVAKEITLLNKIPHPVDAFVQTGVATAGGGWVTVEEYRSEEVDSRTKEAQNMLETAKKAGLTTHVDIDDSPGQVSDVIVEYQNKNDIDMVAMSAESGAFSSWMIGSVAKQVIRHSERPVWVSFRPE